MQVQEAALGSEDKTWQRFLRTLFWLGLVFAGCGVLQYLILLLAAHQHWQAPTMLIFPRPQLFIILLGLPALIQAAARALPVCRACPYLSVPWQSAISSLCPFRMSLGSHLGCKRWLCSSAGFFVLRV